MIPKEEQLDLGTQPRYTRQWGYNASTGSTSLFGRVRDVFNEGARAETHLRNQLRMRIGQNIADQYVSLAADKERDRMGMEMRDRYPNLSGYRAGKALDFDNPKTVIHHRSGESTENIVRTTNTNMNYNYNDNRPPKNPPNNTPKSYLHPNTTTGVFGGNQGGTVSYNPNPTKSIGEADTPAPAKKATAKKAAAKPTPAKKAAAPKAEASTPKSSVAPGPTKKATRTPRPGREGAIPEDRNANSKRKKPEDKTLQ